MQIEQSLPKETVGIRRSGVTVDTPQHLCEGSASTGIQLILGKVNERQHEQHERQDLRRVEVLRGASRWTMQRGVRHEESDCHRPAQRLSAESSS